jgi:hypothetical protein
VKAIYVKNNSTVAVCPIEISVWDNNADVAVVKVIAPNPGHSLFEDFFWLTGDIPKVGEEIAMIGYGEMQELVDLDTPNVRKLKRRLVLRVGRVHAIHSNGLHALKTACVETTIAVYGGMSGGIASKSYGRENRRSETDYWSANQRRSRWSPKGMIGHRLAPAARWRRAATSPLRQAK